MQINMWIKEYIRYFLCCLQHPALTTTISVINGTKQPLNFLSFQLNRKFLETRNFVLPSINSAGTSLRGLTPSKYSALFNKLMKKKIKLSKSRCKHLYYLQDINTMLKGMTLKTEFWIVDSVSVFGLGLALFFFF